MRETRDSVLSRYCSVCDALGVCRLAKTDDWVCMYSRQRYDAAAYLYMEELL